MSGGSNQRTLFQTWGASVSQNKVAPPTNDGKKAAGRRKTHTSNTVKVAASHPPRNPLWEEIGQGSTYTSECPVRIEDPNPAFEDDDDDDVDVKMAMRRRGVTRRAHDCVRAFTWRI